MLISWSTTFSPESTVSEPMVIWARVGLSRNRISIRAGAEMLVLATVFGPAQGKPCFYDCAFYSLIDGTILN
jgi:hypothetical protein